MSKKMDIVSAYTAAAAHRYGPAHHLYFAFTVKIRK
jgi:hypothetical protein